MDARPARRVVLCLTKHLASYWRDIPVATENVADHIQYGIAFGPIEVSVWHLPGSIAQEAGSLPFIRKVNNTLSIPTGMSGGGTSKRNAGPSS
jgi:hypothetical protein